MWLFASKQESWRISEVESAAIGLVAPVIETLDQLRHSHRDIPSFRGNVRDFSASHSKKRCQVIPSHFLTP